MKEWVVLASQSHARVEDAKSDGEKDCVVAARWEEENLSERRTRETSVGNMLTPAFCCHRRLDARTSYPNTHLHKLLPQGSGNNDDRTKDQSTYAVVHSPIVR